MPGGEVTAVRDLGFALDDGETLGIVGESGSGKTVTALAILNLVPPPGRIAGGATIEFRGRDIVTATAAELRAIRGKEIGTVFQNPATALNPVLTVGDQITETLEAHETVTRRVARTRAIELLERVGFPEPENTLRNYPHELSGGMQQRAAIAMALICRPRLLIADEPTTALDVTIQAQVIQLLRDLVKDLGMALILVSHDLGVINQTVERTLVLYQGELAEEAATRELLAGPLHPYTRGLLAAVPTLDGGTVRGIPGTPPPPGEVPRGCVFEARCDERIERCADEHPGITEASSGRRTRCWLAGAPMEAPSE